MDAESNSENASASGEIGGQGQGHGSTAPGSQAATPAAAGAAALGEASPDTGAQAGQTNAVVARLVEPSVEAEKPSSAGEAGRDNRDAYSQAGGSPFGIASSDAAVVDPLRNALAALDRRDYATAKRLFETLGRKDAAEAIERALAALDRKDYATAQALFEALAPPKPAASAGPMASDPRDKARDELGIRTLKVIPLADAAYRRSAPQGAKAPKRGLKPVALGAGLALLAIFGASAIYASRLNWTLAAAKGQTIAGLASAVDLIKARLVTISGPGGREDVRPALRDLGAALTQVTIRLDQIEHDYGARLDKLGERIDQNSARFADLAAAPATPAVEFAKVEARLAALEKRPAVAAQPASELADIVARLDRLEKTVAVPAAGSAKALPPAAPKQSALVARAEPPASNEIAKPENPRPLLRDYAVEDVQNGIAVVVSRYGPQQVAPGDFIPGAGRVLRIERLGGNWVVLTSLGVIASGRAPY